jgi:hypothetical protein
MKAPPSQTLPRKGGGDSKKIEPSPLMGEGWVGAAFVNKMTNYP